MFIRPPSKAGTPRINHRLYLFSVRGAASREGRDGGGGYPLQGDFGILWFLGNKSRSLSSVKNLTMPPHGLKQVNLIKNIYI